MSAPPLCGNCNEVLATKGEIDRGRCIVCGPPPSAPLRLVGPGPNSTVSEVTLESGIVAEIITHPTVRRARGTESPEYATLPRWFLHACERYVENRELIEEPFFASMLTSDVKGIVQGADDTSQTTLFLMLKYLYNHVPSISFGSETAVGAWLRGQPAVEE